MECTLIKIGEDLNDLKINEDPDGIDLSLANMVSTTKDKATTTFERRCFARL